ncbi:hypothetical protein P691DRAFT_801665 [Macrolepiota fuliginosa MF-IS2]|uniref:Uncharacterized protein n=1 Tax=Macrolepiota fuliginosa MF-IS2 TaxID=1400762 RepID=A0A9P5XAM2_9AGAR|nr:hypothetical protein P691DRAFT_801665 [Macrolepiota fuliginosa MF-IS2]
MMMHPASVPPTLVPLPFTLQEDPPTIHPVPLIFEDMRGSLRDTLLRDLEGRGSFRVRTWDPPDEHMGIRIRGSIQNSPRGNRAVFVEWGKRSGEGFLHVETREGPELLLDFTKYLPIVDPEKYTPETIGTATRRFTSFLDAKEYTWQYHPPENLEMEWECVNLEGETVAYWSLKLPLEPEYDSSGCTLTISQGYDMLSLEMIATCFTIRTWQKQCHDIAVRAGLLAQGEDEAEESDSEEAIAKARAAWENRWADCDDSDDSPPSSESDEGENGERGPPSERSTTSSREDGNSHETS